MLHQLRAERWTRWTFGVFLRPFGPAGPGGPGGNPFELGKSKAGKARPFDGWKMF